MEDHADPPAMPDVEGVPIEARERLREAAKEVARANGLAQEKALELVADLAVAFVDGITQSSRFADLEEEWMRVAAAAKRPPNCRSPCVFSDGLEHVLKVRYRFMDMHYLLALRGGSKRT